MFVTSFYFYCRESLGVKIALGSSPVLSAWEVIAILLSMNESYDCPTDSTQHGDHDNDHITRYHHFITPQ